MKNPFEVILRSFEVKWEIINRLMIEKSIILEYRGIDIKDSGKVLRK